MVQLSNDPKGWELEDFVAAHFASRGAYVEAGVTERSPTDILELDVVWTDYRKNPPESHPVEVKSGEVHLGDIFKFYGWTKYLDLPPGQFVHKRDFETADSDTLKRISEKTGIKIFKVEKDEDAAAQLDTLGLPKPVSEELTVLWRFSFWAQRRLLMSLNQAIKQGICPETAKKAKEYHRLINDAVFFTPEIPDRVASLLDAHLGHQRLARSCALETEKKIVDLADPADTETFKKALYEGSHGAVQACMYIAHRARLYVLKAAVDYSLAVQRGEIKKTIIKIGNVEIDLGSEGLHSAFLGGVKDLSKAKSFPMFPAFWQTFLWTWGGFILRDRVEKEYAMLSAETSVPVDEIPMALRAFDLLFPVGEKGWFRQAWNHQRNGMMMMPAVIRGIGSARRKIMYQKDYSNLGFQDHTTNDMIRDHNAISRILDCKVEDLVN
jgi:hypothetical protein